MTDAQKANKEPVNIAAERAVLAAIVQFGQSFMVDTNEILNVDCFTTTSNKAYYHICKDILNDSEKIDVATFIARSVLLGYGDFTQDKSSSEYIKSLFVYNVGIENAIKNAQLLRKLDIARKGMKVAKDIYHGLVEVNGSESLDSIISKVELPVFSFSNETLTSSDDKTEFLGVSIRETVEFLASEKPEILGIPSPWPIYNEAIGSGRRRGGVYLLAARPKTGKSSFAINDAIHVSSLGIPVLYLDTEMTSNSQKSRVLASMSDISIENIEKGKFADNDFLLGKVVTAAKKLEKIPLYYRRVAGKPFEEIISIIKRWVVREVGMQGGKTRDCLIIYDYFKLMNSSSLKDMQEYQAMGFQIQELTDLCNRFEVTCSAYVQMNREGITKDSTDVISQSDRLLWLCSSLALIKRKTKEEILVDGPENGNMKLYVTPEQRFGPGLEDGDWINFNFLKDRCIIKELDLRSNVKRNNSNDGFKTEIADNEEPEFTDEDFDKFDFGDDRYRKRPKD